MSRQQARERGKFVSSTHRPPLPPGYIRGTYFCQRPSRLRSHSAAGKFKSMKNSNYPIGNRTRDLPAFGAMPQPNSYQIERSTKLGNHQTYHRCFGSLRAVGSQIFSHLLSLTSCFVCGCFLCLPIYICISYDFKGVTIKYSNESSPMRLTQKANEDSIFHPQISLRACALLQQPWPPCVQTNKPKPNSHIYCINKYITKSSLLTDMNCDYMFRLKSAIVEVSSQCITECNELSIHSTLLV